MLLLGTKITPPGPKTTIVIGLVLIAILALTTHYFHIL